MPVLTYTLDPENPKRLDISYKVFWRGATVYLDGKEIGTAPGKQELTKGQEFKLPDGSVLKLRLVQSLMGSELRILRNGQPIPGSASHPDTTVKTAYWTLFLIGALGILFGGALARAARGHAWGNGDHHLLDRPWRHFYHPGFHGTPPFAAPLYAGIVLYAAGYWAGARAHRAERRRAGHLQHPVSRPDLHAAGARSGRAAQAEGRGRQSDRALMYRAS